MPFWLNTQWLSAPVLQPVLLRKQLKMEGFIVSRWNDRWDEGIKQNLQWIKEVLTKITRLVNINSKLIWVIPLYTLFMQNKNKTHSQTHLYLKKKHHFYAAACFESYWIIIRPSYKTFIIRSLYRVIHKSLRDFRTGLRNIQDRHGRKEHINR